MTTIWLAVINALQVIILALIAYRQAVVKRNLDKFNGRLEHAIEQVRIDIARANSEEINGSIPL